MATQTTYRWLEPKPDQLLTHQWGPRGRNMTVWHLVADIVVSGQSAEQVALDRDLSLPVVLEALDYYYSNRDWIDAEVEEEGRRLGLK